MVQGGHNLRRWVTVHQISSKRRRRLSAQKVRKGNRGRLPKSSKVKVKLRMMTSSSTLRRGRERRRKMGRNPHKPRRKRATIPTYLMSSSPRSGM
jgi:hypothetical protein